MRPIGDVLNGIRKKKYKQGFKICRFVGGKYFSAFVDGNVTTYKKNRWTKRPKKSGPLAVFDTLKNARDFIGMYSYINSDFRQIINCVYKESKDKILYMTYEDGDIKKKFFPPRGTMFAEKVKLSNRVHKIDE